MHKPRVLEVITHLALGGAERICFTLMRELRADFDFGLFAVSGIEDSDVGRGMKREVDELAVPFYTGSKLTIKRGGLLPAAWRLARAARDFRPDVIHLHTEIPEAVYAAATILSSSLARIPLVRTIHNSVYWEPRRWLGLWCERRMPQPFIATVSEAARESYVQVRQQSGMSPPAFPPVLLLNAVSVPDLPRRRRTFGEPIKLLFSARFELQKGADLLDRIVRQTVLPQGTTVELDLLGSGIFHPQLAALRDTPPPGWRITLAGPVAGLTERMTGYDLMLMPSRFEGLSLLAIESLLLSLPIVATDAPGLRDGLPPDWPWMAKPGDATDYARVLSKALADPTAWPAIAEKGRAFAEAKFDLAVMANGYRELFMRAGGKG
jgi:glycosyltransferase involved in cell wall biosynthesis